MRMLQRRPYFTRPLSPICRGVSVLCGQTDPVHPAPITYISEQEVRALSLRFVPGSSAWTAGGKYQGNGEECRVATSAGEIVETTARQWGVM
jgi:hypothetical protein